MMKFADWVQGTNMIPATNNIRISSEQSSNATGTSPITITAPNTYSSVMNIIPGVDLDVLAGGRQIQVLVEARVPVGSAGGSYSTTYGIKSLPDTVKPIITLNGNASVDVEVTTPYIDAGAMAYDNVDGNITSNIVRTSNVNTAVVGNYTLTYNVSDSVGNTAIPVTRIVHIVDTMAPTITAPADITVEAQGNTTVVSLGLPTVTDSGDSHPTITNNAPVGSLFPLGITKVKWTATDSSGNSASSTQKITVVDTTKPVITLNSPDPVELMVFDEYAEAGAIVTDNYDTGLVPVITDDIDININTLGTYHVHYNVTDSNGNIAMEVIRIVNVVPREITVTANAISKVFGAGDPELTFNLTSGILYGLDTITGSLTRVAGNDVGTYAIQIGSISVGANYNITFVPALLTITPKQATVNISNLLHTYDGTEKSATVTTVPINLAHTITYDGSVVLPKNAGTYSVLVSITDPNYSGSASANLNIDKATVSVTATGNSRVYNGNTNATVNLSVTGEISPDELTATGNASFTNKHVGIAKTINITNIVLSGTNSSNYMSNTQTTTNADITASPVLIRGTKQDKIYDGTTNSIAVPDIIPALFNGDIANYIEVFDFPDVGLRNLTPVGTINDGNGGHNYIITIQSVSSMINKANQTITFETPGDRIIDGNTITLTADSDSDLPITFSGGTANVCSVSSNGTVTILGIGSCSVTAEQIGGDNYNPAVNVTRTFIIKYAIQTPAPAPFQLDF